MALLTKYMCLVYFEEAEKLLTSTDVSLILCCSGQTVRLWVLCSDQQRHPEEKVVSRDSVLDGTGGGFKDPLRH